MACDLMPRIATGFRLQSTQTLWFWCNNTRTFSLAYKESKLWNHQAPQGDEQSAGHVRAPYKVQIPASPLLEWSWPDHWQRSGVQLLLRQSAQHKESRHLGAFWHQKYIQLVYQALRHPQVDFLLLLVPSWPWHLLVRLSHLSLLWHHLHLACIHGTVSQRNQSIWLHQDLNIFNGQDRACPHPNYVWAEKEVTMPAQPCACHLQKIRPIHIGKDELQSQTVYKQTKHRETHTLPIRAHKRIDEETELFKACANIPEFEETDNAAAADSSSARSAWLPANFCLYLSISSSFYVRSCTHLR